MSQRGDILGLTVTEARRLQISTAKHLLWIMSDPDKDMNDVRQYLLGYIEELEAIK